MVLLEIRMSLLAIKSREKEDLKKLVVNNTNAVKFTLLLNCNIPLQLTQVSYWDPCLNYYDYY